VNELDWILLLAGPILGIGYVFFRGFPITKGRFLAGLGIAILGLLAGAFLGELVNQHGYRFVELRLWGNRVSWHGATTLAHAPDLSEVEVAKLVRISNRRYYLLVRGEDGSQWVEHLVHDPRPFEGTYWRRHTVFVGGTTWLSDKVGRNVLDIQYHKDSQTLLILLEGEFGRQVYYTQSRGVLDPLSKPLEDRGWRICCLTPSGFIAQDQAGTLYLCTVGKDLEVTCTVGYQAQ